ncbi:peptidoglycan recognition protein family protein [Poriferisphaera sp. WC338]|uniref:peptidoglycan recognition protein family protein n=1 Tax=Poriferisphaera sp. WC338 TaxID=3425129 RepID=UPI003D8186C3
MNNDHPRLPASLNLSRRTLLLASCAAFLTGCAGSTPSYITRPSVSWPSSAAPTSRRKTYAASTSASKKPVPRPNITHTQRTIKIPRATHTTPTANISTSTFNPIPRSQWTRTQPIKGRVSKMGRINKITVHHEGWTLFQTTSQSATVERLALIHKGHTKSKGWGDIGYHYIIDRAGRVWEGRPIQYQGAHVRANNPNNIGIMLLGNFEKQYPSAAQLSALQTSLRTLRRRYGVPVSRIYTHRELVPTACPGRNLQTRIAALRSAGHFA